MSSAHFRDWPPRDGRDFLTSEEFGSALLQLVKRLACYYPRMDFSDAVAKVFEWFDGKLRDDPMFIGPSRFPTGQSFLAYLRQAVWNAARLTERERRRRSFIGPLPEGHGIIVREIAPDEQAELGEILEAVDSLKDPHKSIFRRHFFDEEELVVLASSFGISEYEIHRIYVEAVDMLRGRFLGD